MKSITNKEFKFSVIVTPQELKYLNDFLEEHFSFVKYVVKCNGGTKLTPLDLKDLLDYENPKFRKIESIVIKASNKELNNHDFADIELGKTNTFGDYAANMSLGFNDIRKQLPFENELIKRLGAMKSWYSFITYASFTLLVPFSIIGAVFFTHFISLVKKLTGKIPMKVIPPDPSPFNENEGFILIAIFVAILFGIGFFCELIRKYFFPKYFFCIGRQKEEFEKRRKVLHFCFVVVLIGLIINLVATKLALLI